MNYPYPQLKKQSRDKVAERPLASTVGLIHMDGGVSKMVRGAAIAMKMLFRAWDKMSATVRPCLLWASLHVVGICPCCRHLSRLKWLYSGPCLFNSLTFVRQLSSASLTCTKALIVPGQEHQGCRGKMPRHPSLRIPRLEGRTDSKWVLAARDFQDSRKTPK